MNAFSPVMLDQILHASSRAFDRGLFVRIASVVATMVVSVVPSHAREVGWEQQGVQGPTARQYHAVCFDSVRGRAVLFGGNVPLGAANANGETWEWDGSAWSQRFVPGPGVRYAHAMAFDSTRGVSVLFGGSSGATALGDTWEWNGTEWSLRTVGGPSPRDNPAMSFDSVRNVVVLFGGTDAHGYNAETWEWDGASWVQRFVPGPSARNGHAMVFDRVRGVTVLFGGENFGAQSSETWEWDGVQWTLRAGTGPSARNGHAMAYDSARGVTVLFGGGIDGTGNVTAETWEWNGIVWVQRIGIEPSSRFRPVMAFDETQGATLLFGGRTADGLLNGETWELSEPCLSGPTVTNQPQAQMGCFNGSVMFQVSVSGVAPVYRWRKNGLPLSNSGSVAGVTTATLTLSGLAVGDAGVFDCLVSNNCGSDTSDPAGLTVGLVGDLTQNNAVNTQDLLILLAFFGGPASAQQGDFDGNGTVDTGDLVLFLANFGRTCS